ncbi:MAG: D-alanyl-D-alanine carboxypeptidase [Epulopiscium sp.]|nr:D-alanyl-D-alanine carboxypeptidase [Candidatus Epulonipiscium sp.]
MKSIPLLFISLWCILFVQTYIFAGVQTPPDIMSESAIVIEAKTGTILYEKNIHEQLPPASITKIMTAYLALEFGKLDDIITFTDSAVFSIGRNSSHLWMVPDEEITLEQALYGMLLQSANEVSNGIAELISGSIEDFAELMTEKAHSLGATKTHFTNPHGLHDEEHYTTAYDMALIAKEAIKNQRFKEIIQTSLYEIPATNKNDIRYLHNQHYMFSGCLKNPKFHYEGSLGGKTGYTDQARHTLVTYASRNNMDLICVVLKSEKPLMYEETTALFDYAFEQFSLVNIAEKNTTFAPIPLIYPKNKEPFDMIETTLENDVLVVLPKDAKVEDIRKTIILPYEVSESVKKHETLGEIVYFLDDQLLTKSPIVSKKNYELPPIESFGIPQSDPNISNSSIPSASTHILRLPIMIILILILLSGLFFVLSIFSSQRSLSKR